MQERIPWTDGAIPHEDAYVQQHVDSRLERVIQGLETEPVIPGECIPRDEACEDAGGKGKVNISTMTRVLEAGGGGGVELTRRFQSCRKCQ